MGKDAFVQSVYGKLQYKHQPIDSRFWNKACHLHKTQRPLENHPLKCYWTLTELVHLIIQHHVSLWLDLLGNGF